MISFLFCIVIIVGGYFTYSKLIEKTYGPQDRDTPAVAINDGVDYVVLPAWRMFMIQLLNIAGLGPIFGVLTGAIWGPIVYLWITFGTVFAGCVHDYFSGMLSESNKGASISEVVGIYLGPIMQNLMRVFSVILLIMVGTVFAVNPAKILVTLWENTGFAKGSLMTNSLFWLVLILVYYFISTFVSIDKIIGKIYPIFGITLIIMAVGVGVGTLMSRLPMPELWDHFYNMHPEGRPVWSLMFITVACGAISGFHATQSPLMARCLKSEKQGRLVFSGAMTAEGVIAMVWALAGCTWYEVSNGMMVGLFRMEGGQATTVYDICDKSMGSIGVILAMLGVVACPITSGDTAFRSARLTIADWFKIDQGDMRKRLRLTIPVLGIGAMIGVGSQYGLLSYATIWNYFSWSNQTLAMIVLWAAAMYLAREKKNFWFCAVPATFMSAVSVTYFFLAKECLGTISVELEKFILARIFKVEVGEIIWATAVAYPAGIGFAVLFFILFWRAKSRMLRVQEADA